MKTKSYLLLISAICGFATAVMAQTNPTTPPKVYKSTPPKPSNPRVKTRQGAPVANPSQQYNTPAGNPRVATPSKDSLAKPAVIKDPNEPRSGGLVNIGLVIGVPQGEFKTNTNGDLGYGIDVSVLANLSSGKRPAAEWRARFVNVYLGGAFQYMRQGGSTDRYSVKNYMSTTNFESKVVNNMYALNVVSRVEVLPGPVKLFAEVSAGGRLFSGAHKLHVEDVADNSVNPNDTRTQDESNNLRSAVVGNYAWGGGLRAGSDMVKVEFKVMYVTGSTAEYVDMKSIQFDRTDNSVTYSTLRSTTDMIVPQVSVSIGF
ncbi:MAG: hypothetical protein V4590_09180 [Bacteroidota bacterium]